ncbi:hypothetical protein Tco_1532971 [Tanacetum coccineum]
MKTPNNPFVAPVNIETIEVFMNKFGYQGVVDMVSAFYMKNLAQPWQTMFKVFNHCLTTRTSGHDQTKINILQLFHAMINRTNVDYVALLWWDFMNNVKQKKEAIQYPRFTKLIIELISNSIYRGDLVPHMDFKEYETMFMKVVEKEKDDDDSEDRIEPESHKDNPEHVDDDDDKNDEEELTDYCTTCPTTTTSLLHTPKRRISSNTNIFQFSSKDVHSVKVVYHNSLEKATEELIENNLKASLAATIIKDHDSFRSEVPDLVSQEFNAQASKIIEELFKNYVQSNIIQVYPTITTSIDITSSANLQQQLYLKLKRSLQDQANDPACGEDDAPPEGENRVKRHKASKEWDAWVEEVVIYEDEVILEDKIPKLITELQDVDKRVPTIFDYARMKATLNDEISNQFKNAEEYAYHLEQTTNFMENQIVWESRQEDIRRPVPRPLIFFGPQRNPNEPPSGDCEVCDATLEKVLKEVKLKIFQSEPWKKPPLLGELDCDIMRAFEREITKRLSHREQMRRWESFVNRRPILSMMKRL